MAGSATSDVSSEGFLGNQGGPFHATPGVTGCFTPEESTLALGGRVVAERLSLRRHRQPALQGAKQHCNQRHVGRDCYAPQFGSADDSIDLSNRLSQPTSIENWDSAITSRSAQCARNAYYAMFVYVCPRKLRSGLCQNCVRYPTKPRSNTVIYGATPMHIVVAGSR
jgi:hypothetical protein